MAEQEAPSPLPAGRTITVTLSEPPAKRYQAAPMSDSDTVYERLVRELSSGRAVYDPSLARAAREFVFQATELGMSPPSDVREFLAMASGAIAGDTTFQHARSADDAEPALRRAIAQVVEQPPAGAGVLHIGVGEVYQPGQPQPRHIGVVGTVRDLELAPLDRAVAAGGSIQLSGRLLRPWQELEALVLRPDGKIHSQTVQVRGDAVSVAVPAGDQPGAVLIQLVGEGPLGPGRLVQVQVEVAQPPPSQFACRLPADESGLATADEAAHAMFALVNADRRQHGLPPLVWDSALAAIAREHSVDMRDQQFFGHRSPTTGLHGDRLKSARYRSVASAENLAYNGSVAEAERGLMHSLGHRRNLLDPTVTHLGVGVAGRDLGEGHRRWWLTQLFAKPTVDLDPVAAVAELQAKVAAVRRAAGLAELRADPALDAVAREVVALALSSDVQAASAQALALARERQLVSGRLRAWAGTLPELERLVVPDSAREAAASRLGMALTQARTDDDGRVAVVLLVAD